MAVGFVPRRSRSWSRRLILSRHLVQAAVVGWVAWLIGSKAASADAASPEAFCPFGGFETAWTWVTTGRTVSHVHTSNLVLAAVITVLALAARGFFCGWVCPLGTLQEAVTAGVRMVTGRIPGARRSVRRIRARAAWWPALDRVLRFGRYAVLVWALAGAAFTGAMVFRAYDPWRALLSVADFEISTGVVVLAAVLLLSALVDRPFCRYACPLGAAQSLVGRFSPVAVQRDSAACLGCEICNAACPMGIAVNACTRVSDAACIGCLQCVAACPSRDALTLSFSLPTRAKPQPIQAATAAAAIPEGALS